MRDSSRRNRSGGWRSAFLVVTAVGALSLVPFGAREAAGAQPPRVLVVFEASTPQFPGLADPGLRARAAETIRGKCAKNWPFVAWTADHEAPATPGGDWVLETRVEAQAGTREIAGRTARDWRVVLRHFVRRPDGTSWEIATNSPQLYDIGQPKPSDVPTLEKDLGRLIEQQFNREFLDRVWEQFVREIPIGDRVVLDPAGERVIVPLRLRELQAKEDSQLKATFKRTTGDGGVRRGYLFLRTSFAVEDGANVGYIYGPIVELNSPPDNPLKEVNWDPRLAVILGSASDFHVFMFTYVKDPAAGALTSGGLILDPESGGGAP